MEGILPKNSATKLTPQQEKFVNLLVQGLSQRQAFLKAYPNNKMKLGTVDNYASRIFKSPKVFARYQELLEEFREREKEKTGWTREQSIETLRFVIDTNRKDLERIQQAAIDELVELEKQVIEHPELAPQLIQMVIKQKKQTRANKTNNDALISATSVLNQMLGYNEQTINMNGAVVFEGESELEE